MIRAAIAGASGYAGGELLRLLLSHPEVEVVQITSETYAGQFAYFVHPNLRGHTNLKFTRLVELEPCDILFLALPHGRAMDRIDHYASLAERIVDLSADFRLRNPADYPAWYEHRHSAPEWLDRFVYGVPELHRYELAGTRYATGTGCNAMVSLLALWPVFEQGLVREAVVDVKAGSSEGGAKPGLASHHPERAGVVRSYALAQHRHQAELFQELALDPVQRNLHLSITSIGTVRGALATCHCLLHEEMDEKVIWKIYRQAYGDEPFVRLVRAKRGIHRFPEPKILSGSNYCDIGFTMDSGNRRLIVVSAIDNLMKGAAGNAVQVMNIMCNLNETLGLEFPGLHPI
ncbi:MAG: N-acetyl-gamma-glutamyl-phosphate reductase [Anaerolineales bacterium]|nr:N-acetyl-gamma-glutamyl-phosphate reductase [Anaerolineales bacterium]